jgi:peroxiredoxin
MTIRIALVALVALSLAMLSLSGCNMSKAQPQAQSQVRTEEQVRPIEGKPFPKIALEAASGKTLSTETFRGKVVVLNVWATWCPPCRREMPSLEALSKRLDARRFAVVGLSTDDDAMLAREFLRQNDITFTNFFDRNGRISRQFDLEVYPETFLIGPDGTLIQRVPGMRDWSSPEMVAFLEMTYDTYRYNIARRAE